MSVLIADDDEMLVRALTVRCQKLGLEIRQAYDAMQALVMINQKPPNLIIMDVHMPAGDGLSACQMMASDERLSKIPVIVLTGQDNEQVRGQAQALKAHYVVKSPQAWTQLKPLICRLLNISENPPICQSTEPGSPSQATSPRSDHMAGPLVLIVEDDPDVTQAISIRLQSNGLRAMSTGNGVQAFELAKDHQPDVMTLDIGLPGMDGLGLMQNLKNHPLTKNIPVIVVSGEKDQGLQDILLKLGACSFLTKPFSTLDLMKEVQRALPRHTRRRSSAATTSGDHKGLT